jgi:beta-phosphoglucomutase-like phosphatase (HAD superfamily)
LLFDFDGLMDSERVEADCVIEVLARWGITAGYQDFGHLFGSVDAAEQWDALVQGWSGPRRQSSKPGPPGSATTDRHRSNAAGSARTRR